MNPYLDEDARIGQSFAGRGVLSRNLSRLGSSGLSPFIGLPRNRPTSSLMMHAGRDGELPEDHFTLPNSGEPVDDGELMDDGSDVFVPSEGPEQSRSLGHDPSQGDVDGAHFPKDTTPSEDNYLPSKQMGRLPSDTSVSPHRKHVSVVENRALQGLTVLPRGVRAKRLNHARSHVIDAYSQDEHIWLIHQHIGCPALMKRFHSVSQLERYARRSLAEGVVPPTAEALERLQEALAQSSHLPQGHAATVAGSEKPNAQAGAVNGSANPVKHPLRVRAERGSVRHSFARPRGPSRASKPPSNVSRCRPSTSSSGSSSSSSTSTHSTSNPLTQACWLDVQTANQTVIREVLNLFPVHPLTVNEVLDPDSFDAVEAFSSFNYVFVNIACNHLKKGDQYELFGGAQYDKMGENIVLCSVICFEDWIITVHPAPFSGLVEVVKNIQNKFSLRRHNNRCTVSADPTRHSVIMSASWVLATLLDYVVETFLPDPTKVLADVDSVDEMVLLIAPGDQDQPDLLRRVALLRRRISTQRALLFKKEQLLQYMLMPMMRTSFISRHSYIADLYKHTLAEIMHVAERLDTARDILNQANMNFVATVTMKMSQDSARMDFRMQILSQVATVCLPPTLLSGIFGMNVLVPFQEVQNLNAFWGIIGIMVLWLVICLIPTIRDFCTRTKSTPMIEDGSM